MQGASAGIVTCFVKALGDHSFSGQVDWNRRTVQAFEEATGITVPCTISREWNDWIKFLAGEEPLVIAQTDLDTPWCRWCGIDSRSFDTDKAGTANERCGCRVTAPAPANGIFRLFFNGLF